MGIVLPTQELVVLAAGPMAQRAPGAIYGVRASPEISAATALCVFVPQFLPFSVLEAAQVDLTDIP